MNAFPLLRYLLGSPRRRRSSKPYDTTEPIVDVHAHYVPDFYRETLIDAGIDKPDGWPMPEWSIESALAMMDRFGIAKQILSLSSPGIGFAGPAAARSLARRLNEFVSETMKRHPERFGGFAILPLPDVAGSIEELRHALDVLNLNGVCLLTNYDGVYLGDPAFEALFAELDRRAVTVFVHPTVPHGCNVLTCSIPPPVMEFPFDSTRMAANLILSGTMKRYRKMKVIVAHGGGTIPYLYPRLLAGVGEDGPRAFGQFYYDLTATSTPGQTELLRRIVGADRLLMGFDYPFMGVDRVVPLLAGLHLSGFSRSELAAIKGGTARTLLGLK